jgi:hypothetical protein
MWKMETEMEMEPQMVAAMIVETIIWKNKSKSFTWNSTSSKSAREGDLERNRRELHGVKRLYRFISVK